MSKIRLPHLSRLTEMEARAVESMFRLYDYNSKGRIPQHLAYKLCKTMGFDVSIHSLPVDGSLKDILLFVDMRMPDPEPALHSQLQSFVSLVAKQLVAEELTDGLEGVEDDGSHAHGGGGSIEDEESASGLRRSNLEESSLHTDPQTGSHSSQVGRHSNTKYITTKAINDFMASLGRPPVPEALCELMLTRMLEFDDCAEHSGGKSAVMPDSFMDNFTNFAKKSNALKNFK